MQSTDTIGKNDAMLHEISGPGPPDPGSRGYFFSHRLYAG